MPPMINASILKNIPNLLKANKPKVSDSNKPKIRKRHWALGTMVILGGSWITHTTTATISSPSTARLETSLKDVQLIPVSPPIQAIETDQLALFLTNAGHSSEINTCLLYTSPSPRDQRGSRMPSSA